MPSGALCSFFWEGSGFPFKKSTTQQRMPIFVFFRWASESQRESTSKALATPVLGDRYFSWQPPIGVMRTPDGFPRNRFRFFRANVYRIRKKLNGAPNLWFEVPSATYLREPMVVPSCQFLTPRVPGLETLWEDHFSGIYQASHSVGTLNRK